MQRTPQLFTRLVDQHQRMVYGIALRLLGDPGEAEEVAQDVFLELHDALPRLDSEDHIRYWLRRVATHRATDALRRRNRRPENAAVEWEDELHGRASPSAQNTGIAARLETMVRSLPEPYRTAIVLRYTDDVEPEEIAGILAQPIATVRSNLQRGLTMLRRKAQITLKEWAR